MDTEQIRSKHASLVIGGYADMIPSARINYHTRTTLMAIVDELEDIGIRPMEETQAYIKNRISEINQLLEP